MTLKLNESGKDIEQSRAWLRAQIKDIRYPQPGIAKKSEPGRNKLFPKLTLGVLILVIIIAIIIAIVWNREPDLEKQAAPEPVLKQTTTPVKPIIAPAVSKPIATNEVPSPDKPTAEASPAASNYPSGWPEELRYPAQFNVVDANTVRIDDNALPAYAAKMGFDGDMQTAADSFSSYFETRGWQIVERSELDSGAIQIKVARYNDRDSGNIIIDPDPLNTGKVRIVAIIFF